MASETESVALAEKTLRPLLHKSGIDKMLKPGQSDPKFLDRLSMDDIWKLIYDSIYNFPTPRPLVSLADAGLVQGLFDILLGTHESAKYKTSYGSVFCRALEMLLSIVDVTCYPDRTSERYLSGDISWSWNGHELKIISALRDSCLFKPIHDEALRLELATSRQQALQIIQAIREMPEISYALPSCPPFWPVDC
ncbi:hypothetical protein DL93DRAFT_1420830 [Clavulina sp. PMI_390]|nr:hypothetical protein DL93DRAFT_1420830 [Clavulina sp. PMI_390]